MLITNDFSDHDSLMDYLKDFVVGTSPVKVRITNPTQKKVMTRYMQPLGLQQAFYQLVADWRESGPNLKVFLKKHPDLKARMTHGKTVLYIAMDGSAHIGWAPTTAPLELDGESTHYISEADRALDLFMRFITSPLQDRLDGPCANPKCGRLFFRASKRVRKYCSKRCSLAVSAISATKKQRKELREKKLALARSAIESWLAAKRPPKEWKRWVERHTSTQKRVELRLTTKWLTRAIRKGELADPNGTKLGSLVNRDGKMKSVCPS